VELNLAVRPWLLLMDARKALVSDEGGGKVREPGYVLASGDPIALDVAAVKLLKGYPAKNRLDLSAWGFPKCPPRSLSALERGAKTTCGSSRGRTATVERRALPGIRLGTSRKSGERIGREGEWESS
jgi:hypothetical protein